MPRRHTLLLAIALAASAPSVRGEQKPAKPDDLPKIVVAIPLGVTAGATTKVTLRGLKLDGATEVRCQAPVSRVKLLAKGAAGGVPRGEDVPRVGNTQAEVEITLPADYPGSAVTVTVLTAAGESNAHRLVVDRSPAVAEKEPNNGFAQAQPITFDLTVAGVIERGFDVDVYRFEGRAGQRVTAEVFAARHGSALDSLLTLYTGDGQTLAANDDLDASTRDSRLEVTLPRDGTYYLVLIDANDHGSPAHVYRLSLRRQ
jgi:hypothetical protein